jgi:hypothetical protein
MLRAKLIVVAMTLIFAQVHCALACAGLFCDANSTRESTPPCHRHHSQSNHKDAESCTREAIVQLKGSTQALQLEISASLVPHPAQIDVWAAFTPRVGGEHSESRSPRAEPDRLSPVVLRV